VDSQGRAVVAGTTESTDLPVSAALDSQRDGNWDGWVAKLDASGSSAVFVTYFGGGGDEELYGVGVDGSGAVYIAGSTWSTDLPTTAGAYQTQFRDGSMNGYLFKLSADGSSIVYGTYFGRTSVRDVAVDASGNAYLAGFIGFDDLPASAGAFQPAIAGGADAFVAKIAPAGDRAVWATYLGGSSDEIYHNHVVRVAVDGQGRACVVGSTFSQDYPQVNPPTGFPSGWSGGFSDAFVTKLSADGSSALYSGYLGGSGTDEAWGVATDAAGRIVVVGFTGSTDFPLVTPLDSTMEGNDAFVTEIAADGGQISFSTLLGGELGEVANDVAIDASGLIHVAGGTGSHAFPTTPDAFQTDLVGSSDAFLTRLPAGGGEILYSTRLGGFEAFAGDEAASAVAVDATGATIVAGWTRSSDFPGVGSGYQSTLAGSRDGFVARITGPGAGPDQTYLIPAVAHNPGAGGTMWRSDVAVINTATAAASLDLSFYPTSGQARTGGMTLPAGATMEWRNVLETVFGVSSADSIQGTIVVGSDQPLVLSARTYNQAASGTYGQYLQACTMANSLAAGTTGYLPQMKSTSEYRTNLGVINVAGAQATVEIRLFNGSGTQVGSSKTLAVAGQRWTQIGDIFGNVGAGSQSIAYATVVVTAGGPVWAYASVVDEVTGDGTTIPVLTR
jgi:hypothetical protein